MSAERSRFFGPLERRALALAFACTACVSIDFSDNQDRTERSSAGLLELFCKSDDYELEGSAKKTSGLTSDSCGFSVGPGDGKVKLILDETVVYRYQNYTFEALVTSGDGTNAKWRAVFGEDHGVGKVAFPISSESGKLERIVDVRVVGELRPGVIGCSIARRAR
jgi:hypothetical protein